MLWFLVRKTTSHNFKHPNKALVRSAETTGHNYSYKPKQGPDELSGNENNPIIPPNWEPEVTSQVPYITLHFSIIRIRRVIILIQLN